MGRSTLAHPTSIVDHPSSIEFSKFSCQGAIMTARLPALLLLVVAGGVALAMNGSSDDQGAPALAPLPASGLVPVELATVGVDAVQNAPVVLLRDPTTGKVMPILVGIAEAQAILTVMLGVEMPRPMTHDLLVNVVRELGAEVEEVVVHEMRGTTFIGRIRLRMDGEEGIREVDSRPSDALALAVRTDAPIHVAETLLADPPRIDFMAPEADEQVVRILGLTVVVPNRALRERYGQPRQPGLMVVGAYGEAAERGIRRGDIITGVNGEAPLEPMAFLRAVMAAPEVVRLRIVRDREVDGVDRCGGDLHPDLARPGRLDGNADDLDRISSARGADDGGAEGGGAHVSLLCACNRWLSCTTMGR
jgi:uncharacterized protein